MVDFYWIILLYGEGFIYIIGLFYYIERGLFILDYFIKLRGVYLYYIW